MAAKTRRGLIEQRIADIGEIEFSSLASEFDVSEMTIRRDIESLEAKGVARRVFGGAIALVGKSSEPSFATRASAGAAVKDQLAAAVVELLLPHETVILDSGSTVLAVARAIKGKDLDLTIVTPSVLVSMELTSEPGTTVLLTGGRVRVGEMSLVGVETEEAFARYNCDTYVMGIAGVDAAKGITEYHREEGNVKRAAVQSADRIIVVADSTKIGRVQLMNIAPLSAIHVLVTDADPAHPALVAARVVGVMVVCVPNPGAAEVTSRRSARNGSAA